MNCSLPESSVRGISQARILECVAISFSRASSWPTDRIPVSCIAGRFFTNWATGEAPQMSSGNEWLNCLTDLSTGTGWLSSISTLVGWPKPPECRRCELGVYVFRGLICNLTPFLHTGGHWEAPGSESVCQAVSSSVWTEHKPFSTFRKWISKCCSGLEPAFFFKMNYYLFIWPQRVACGILVPQSGTEPRPPVLEARSLNHWTAGEVPDLHSSFFFFFKEHWNTNCVNT